MLKNPRWISGPVYALQATRETVLLHDENHRAVLLAQFGGVIGIAQQAGIISHYKEDSRSKICFSSRLS